MDARAALPAGPAAALDRPDWNALAARARRRRGNSNALLYGALALGSLPIVSPYLWLFTVALSGRTGATTVALWRTLAILMPALVAWSLVRVAMDDMRRIRLFELAIGVVTLGALAAVLVP